MPIQWTKTYANVSGVQDVLTLPSGQDVSIATAVTGTITYSIELQLVPNGLWAAPPELSGLTASLLPQSLDGPVNALRTNVTAGTGTVQIDVAADYRGG